MTSVTNDFERINAPRVEKILGMIDTIEKSAKSNDAGDDMAMLLNRVRERLGVEVTVVRRSTLKAPSWVNAQEFAATLSLTDLGYVLATVMNRVDEALDEVRVAK